MEELECQQYEESEAHVIPPAIRPHGNDNKNTSIKMEE